MVLSCPFLVCFRIAIFILVFIIIYIYIYIFFISVCYIFQTSYIIFESTSFKFLQLHHLAINLITCPHLAVIICVCLASIVVPVCNVLYSIDVRVLIGSPLSESSFLCILYGKDSLLYTRLVYMFFSYLCLTR